MVDGNDCKYSFFFLTLCELHVEMGVDKESLGKWLEISEEKRKLSMKKEAAR